MTLSYASKRVTPYQLPSNRRLLLPPAVELDTQEQILCSSAAAVWSSNSLGVVGLMVLARPIDYATELLSAIHWDSQKALLIGEGRLVVCSCNDHYVRDMSRRA